ncbi:MAG: Type 1 glutamine amidotransferase-like domain-containing protein [Bacilli bacterium]|nr:Type 1 glutamine amidotransferase-like domain-containing protein [Bacilli bacterium]
MKIEYLLSGFDKNVGFTGEVVSLFQQDIKDNSTITFIASSFGNYEKTDKHYNNLIKFFKDININFKNVYLIDNRITKDAAQKYILESDVVFLMGGDPEKEMMSIKEYDLVDILRERCGLTIGVSAGSMNMASYVCYLDEEKGIDILEYGGIGLTNLYIYPHLDLTNIDYIKEIFDVSKKKDLILLPDNSFIRIENGKEKIYGEHYYLRGVE